MKLYRKTPEMSTKKGTFYKKKGADFSARFSGEKSGDGPEKNTGDGSWFQVLQKASLQYAERGRTQAGTMKKMDRLEGTGAATAAGPVQTEKAPFQLEGCLKSSGYLDLGVPSPEAGK